MFNPKKIMPQEGTETDNVACQQAEQQDYQRYSKNHPELHEMTIESL